MSRSQSPALWKARPSPHVCPSIYFNQETLPQIYTAYFHVVGDGERAMVQGAWGTREGKTL